MKRTIGIVMILLMLMSVTVAVAGIAKDTQTGGERVKVIIGFVDMPDQDDENMIRGHGGKTKYTYDIINAKAVEIPEQAIERIKKDPRVKYVEVDARVHALDTELNNSWGVKRIGAGVVHGYNKGAGVNVSIIDTGIDYTHPDLDANYKGGYDYVNNDADPLDDNGHGTHCAGIVAAEDNDMGVVGVAPDANLYAVKVLDAAGSGYVSDVVVGIQWSIDNGMQIISMSLGGGPSVSLETACNNAYKSGIVVVAAAGNDYSSRGRVEFDTVDYPGRYDSVIAIGATDSSDEKASWSSTGPDVELAAPGVSIYSTIIGGYDTKSGTSMACPHVAGTAALVIAAYPEWTNTQVRQQLRDTADDLGAAGFDYWYGYGLVDADEAAPGVDTTPPTISDLTPADGLVNTGTPTISATVTDVSGIDAASIDMTVDEAVVHTYDNETGLVSYTPNTFLAEGVHTVTLNVSDTVGNSATACWSFTVDTTPPAPVTGLKVTTVSSSQLDLSWSANTETDIDHYNVYRNTTYDGPYNLVASPTTNSYSDAGLAASTTYYYTVTAVNMAGNEGIASDEANGTTSEASAVQDFANQDIPVSGTVSEDYTYTHDSDNTSESITEVSTLGRRSSRYSYLEHRWTIDVAGGTKVTFNVEAYHNANTENDHFIFAYSTDDGIYTDMLTVTKTEDDDTLQICELPETLSGTVYIRVVDTDQTWGYTVLDTIYIDQMYIESVP